MANRHLRRPPGGPSRSIALLLALTLTPERLSPCDTWVAVGAATGDGSVILAKNSDRSALEAQPFQYVPRQRPTEKEVQCTHIRIPQVAETYAHFGSRLWWTFGYEMGTT